MRMHCVGRIQKFELFKLGAHDRTARLLKVRYNMWAYIIVYNVKGISTYTGCNRRNGPDFGRVFLRSYYTDITQNTYIQSSMVTEILAREV